MKTIDFSCIGLVHPSEYDWKRQMLIVKERYKNGLNPYMNLDVGKIMGLCKYIIELEEELECLRQKKN